MSIRLELFRGTEQDYVGEVDFAKVLRRAARRQWGELDRKARIHIDLEEPADPEPYPGPPEVRNVSDAYGHCRLRLVHDGETLRDERLRITDLLGPVLAEELHTMALDEAHWGFRLRQRRVLTVLVAGELVQRLTGEERPVPEVRGAVEIDLGERRHHPFKVTPIAGADVDEVEPAALGLDPDELTRLNILMPADIHRRFHREMRLSARMEEGGFLLGRVTKADEEIHFVEVTHITPAHQSGAGMAHFTFTGDSFMAVAQLIAERGGEEELVGWYHTHPSGVDKQMGLSSIDVDLHLSTFQRPWQVAALINLRRDGRRLLRFYGRSGPGAEHSGKELEEYHQWIADDSGRYRRAAPELGGD